MNNSFEYVLRSSLNNSTSKQAHGFSKSQRFLPFNKTNCITHTYDHHNDLSSSFTRSKQRIGSKAQRFRTSATLSPSPDKYMVSSFVDMNSHKQRGNKLGDSKKLILKTNGVPGPGSYLNNFNPEKKLSYTMRSKINHKDHSSKLGPGHYNPDKYNTITKNKQYSNKYANSFSTVINKSHRFGSNQTVSPGPFMYSKTTNYVGSDPNYRFAGEKKSASYIARNKNPGPGSYEKFSQFSELKGGLGGSRTRVDVQFE